MGEIAGTLIDPIQQRTYGARITWSEETGKITEILSLEAPPAGFILPGFVDSHVHLECSMLTPTEFARTALRHGTIGAVADPHEIANVLGASGIDWMIQKARQTPFVFGIGAPSSVPNTDFETSGAKLNALAVRALLQRPEITHLSEIKDLQGVLHQDPEVMAKIEAAKEIGKPIDGNAPQLEGEDLTAYVNSGISTDHKCISRIDAQNKLDAGMILQIRHGSSARLQNAILQLLSQKPDNFMFCTDDKLPSDLLKHHINYIAAQAHRNGIALYPILKAASVNAVKHYNLPIGLLQTGDWADFQIVDKIDTFTPLEVWIHGKCVVSDGEVLLPRPEPAANPINRFDALPLEISDIALNAPGRKDGRVNVIQVQDTTKTTRCVTDIPTCKQGKIVPDTDRDLLKIALLNRYDSHARPVVGLIHGFGLTRGAIASSIAHDSHSLIAVGANDRALQAVMNEIIFRKGGLAVADNNGKIITTLPLPIAGLISDQSAQMVAKMYDDCDTMTKLFGSPLTTPFLLLSFLALPMIPEVRITDKGLFNVTEQKLIPFYCENG